MSGLPGLRVDHAQDPHLATASDLAAEMTGLLPGKPPLRSGRPGAALALVVRLARSFLLEPPTNSSSSPAAWWTVSSLSPTRAVQVCPGPVGVALSGSRVFVSVRIWRWMSLKPSANYPLKTDTKDEDLAGQGCSQCPEGKREAGRTSLQQPQRMGSTACSPWISGFGRKTVGEYISAALSHELVVIAYSSPRTLRQPPRF